MELMSQLFWLFILIAFLSPLLQQRLIAHARQRKLAEFERRRGSRVITLIHRQEAISLLGIPVGRFIDVDDSEQVLRAIRMTDEQMPIDMVLHTPGGMVLAAEQIAEALAHHPGKVSVFIPHYAMSGGTLIALAANEIVMDRNAVVGPVDPQIGGMFDARPAASVLAVLARKEPQHIDDETLILADQAAKALRQVKRTVRTLLLRHFEEARAEALAETLSQGTWTHDYPISATELRELGLPVNTDMPAEVYSLMALYPQPRGRRPSVQYTPGPYPGPGRNRR